MYLISVTSQMLFSNWPSLHPLLNCFIIYRNQGFSELWTKFSIFMIWYFEIWFQSKLMWWLLFHCWSKSPKVLQLLIRFEPWPLSSKILASILCCVVNHPSPQLHIDSFDTVILDFQISLLNFIYLTYFL